mgnify:CR=1 FL=1
MPSPYLDDESRTSHLPQYHESWFPLENTSRYNTLLGREMKNTLVALVLAVCILAGLFFAAKTALTPRTLGAEDPRRAFESFVCSPIPEGDSDVNASGVVAFAGGDAHIAFSFRAGAIEEILELGGFRPYKKGDSDWISSFEPPGFSGSLSRYVRADPGTSEDALFVSADTGRAWYREVQF